MLKPNMRLIWLAIVLMSCSLLLFSAKLWARLMMPPSMADVHALAEKSHWFFADTFSQSFRYRATRSLASGISTWRRFTLTVGIGERDQRKKRYSLHMAALRVTDTIVLTLVWYRIGLYLPKKSADNLS